MAPASEPPPKDEFEYIIVGSGAGGAPLAARLAQAGKRVLVIEAGSNHTAKGPREPANEVSRVPLLHAASTEHEALAWRFFVDHYERTPDGRLPDGIKEDPKWHNPTATEDETHNGIFYPRSAGIGGCTVHNAMITIAGLDSDWDDLADYLKDDSWRGNRMRGYFQKLEHNDYQPVPDNRKWTWFGLNLRYIWTSLLWVLGFGRDPTGGKHGFGGWLHTSVTDLSLGLADKQLVKMLKAALWQSRRSGLERAWTLVSTFLRGRVRQSLDPNHSVTQATHPEGLALIPLAVYGGNTTIHQNSATPYAMLGRRSSPREFLLETLATYPDNLKIRTDCLVTRILLDDSNPPRAIGVELRQGERLYRAHVKPSQDEGTLEQVFVKSGGEVILSGGTFNTPQMLMLSGIGDRDLLASVPDPKQEQNDGIQCRVHLPGVGKNMQDRYEVSLVSQMKHDFSLLDGATFKLPDDPNEPDRHLRQWRNEGTGLYTSNGAVLGIFKRSSPDLPKPDLFIFGVPSQFKGYAVGYSEPSPHNLFTWVILKSHSQNRDGTVQLRTMDPRDTPRINFNSFQTKSRPRQSVSNPDVLALLDGVKFVRGIFDCAKWFVGGKEIHPAQLASTDNDQAAVDWIRSEAWGHHACGTCRMGPDGDPDAVLDSRFRVRGVNGLRVVDASIFPRIPGYFIVSNIYMASEKAADVILQDANFDNNPPTYPLELRELEAEAIGNRRKVLDPNDTVGVSDWNDDVAGLALSGGGIRSSTLALGVLQSLARNRLLRKIDFLSTVSGGGYIGSFLGRFYDRLRPVSDSGISAATGTAAANYVESELISPDSNVIDWLRKHGNYIAPHGNGDGRLNFAVFIRNLLSVQLVVGMAIFTMFGLANAIRYVVFDSFLAASGLALGESTLPLCNLMRSLLGPFFSPWFILVDLLLLVLVVPRITGYWIVSQDKHESFKSAPAISLFFVAAILLLLGVGNGLRLEPLSVGLSLLSSVFWVELAWDRGRRQEDAVGTGGVESQRLRTRNYLTYDLGLALSLTGGAIVFAVIDTIGHGLHEWKLAENRTYTQVFAGLGVAIMAALPLARTVAGYFTDQRPGPVSTVSRILKRDMIAGGMAAVLFTLPLVFYSFAAHAAFFGGTAILCGSLVTLLTLVLTVTFAHPSAVVFVNRSSLAQTYSARLARAFLGASNPLRHRPSGINVTEVIPGDDVPSIRDYRPHEASGPFHLINMTIDQTVDKGSLLRKRDRQGNIMAVSCLGMTIGETSHSAWQGGDAADTGHRGPTGLRPLGRAPGEEHPLVDVFGNQADHAEMLSLRQWIGISGAALDPGRGQGTTLGTSLLMGMINLRTGHWWDSGIAESNRTGFPKLTFLRRLLYLVPRIFTTQALLIYEWIARFPGSWERYWHLSDGGYFECLGGYELIRRRIPRIIISDACADPQYRFSELGELVRKSRIDFATRIVSFTAAEIGSIVPANVQSVVGTFDEIQPPIDANGVATGPASKHAALFWVHYPDQSRRSVMLYLKATLTGDESPDVRHYHETHPEFPHEGTADQFFDEAQWESYRKLGEHLSGPLFEPASTVNWFWTIPLPSSDAGAP